MGNCKVKKCTKCGEDKSVDSFTNASATRDGKYPRCRECTYAGRETDEFKRKYKEYCKSRPAKVLYSNAKARAKSAGLPFDIKQSDIFIPEMCPYLGVPLERGEGKHCPNSPSIDRIVPQLGYVNGNIIVVSHRANSIKQNATPDELRRVADAVEAAMAARKLN